MKMLTLPAEGLMVPTSATRRTTASVVEKAKAMPVAIIRPDAATSTRR
jgi:hypothetical protein